MLSPTFYILCIFKKYRQQINKPNLLPVSGWAALPAALACGRQEGQVPRTLRGLHITSQSVGATPLMRRGRVHRP